MTLFFSKPSEESIGRLKKLPLDAVRVFLDYSDWKSAASFCQVFPSPCRSNYWENRAKKEFGEESWIVSYKYPLHNYMAARVRWLSKKKKRDLTSEGIDFTSPPEERLTMNELDVGPEVIQEGKGMYVLSNREMGRLLNTINKHESKNRYDSVKMKAVKAGKVRLLREYFGLDPSFEEQEKKNWKLWEIPRISNFLASYLKREFPKIFLGRYIPFSPNQLEYYFSMSQGDHISREKTREFSAEFSFPPDSLGGLYEKPFRIDDSIIYIFIDQNEILHWSSDMDDLVFRQIFTRMRQLGITPSSYHLLYPRFFGMKMMNKLDNIFTEY